MFFLNKYIDKFIKKNKQIVIFISIKCLNIINIQQKNVTFEIKRVFQVKILAKKFIFKGFLVQKNDLRSDQNRQ